MDKDNFELSWRTVILLFFLFFWFFFFFSSLIYYNWSWLVFIRFCVIVGMLVLLLYKIIQFLLIKCNIKLNIILLDKFYKNLFLMYELFEWYNIASNEIDERYIPKFYLEKKNIVDNKYVKMFFIFFFWSYLINNVILQYYHLNFIWNIGFLLIGFYFIFIILLDIKYIFPNLYKFGKTSILFNPGGLYDNWTPTMRRNYLLYGRYGSTFVKFCYVCVAGVLGCNWVYTELQPDTRSPLARVGDRYNYHVHNIEIPPTDNSHLKKIDNTIIKE